MQDLLRQVLSEARSAWRFRWHGAVAAWVVGIIGLGVVMWLPDVFGASARVYVDGSSVLRPLLNDRIVPPDVNTHLMYVRQALLGRDYLERIASENGLIAPGMSLAERERALDRLKKTVVIDAAPAGAEGGNRNGVSTIFTISYRDRKSEVAVGVVRSFMNKLIEDTLGASREGTDKAAKFLDDRIAEHEARLEKAEKALADFQRANSGKLPGSEGGYFARMQAERDALEKTRRDLRLAQSRRDRLEQQLKSETPGVIEDPGLTKEPRPNSLDARIRDQRAELDRMLLQYTERHPAVIALRESVERLEAQRAEQLRALGVTDSDQQISAVAANPVYQAVQIALNEVQVQIATLEADARDREQKLRDLQALINEVPAVEAELSRLNRDYNVIKDQYQALIQSREKQQLSEQASTTDQVEFRVLNPPLAELKPVAPKRLLLLGGVMFLALAAGAGLTYVLSQLKPVFGSAGALQEISGFPVIGCVSRVVLDPQNEHRRRIALATFSAAVFGLVLMIGGMAAFEQFGSGIHSLIRAAG
jgi:polysaccharide chain length determinant protein (PEP-CTERM system associated)